MDLFARSRWSDYSRARDAMLEHTHSKHAPWTVVPADDKQSCRLNLISDLLSRIPYTEIPSPPLELPPKDSALRAGSKPYVPPKEPPAWQYVKPLYTPESLMTNVSEVKEHPRRHSAVEYAREGGLYTHAGDDS
jgi:hypothetical protein